jgi:two-component system sporulation sensor kinase B
MISFIPSFVIMGIVSIYMKWNQIPMSVMSNLIGSMLLFAVFQVLAVYLSAMIYEVCHERIGMKQEIRQNEKLKTLGQLAASMAHEVRNPLTVVKGFLQLMRPHENGKNGYYLGIAMGELDRTVSIIESMNGQITYESELGAGTTVTITVQYRAVIGEKADTYFNWVPDPVD